MRHEKIDSDLILFVAYLFAVLIVAAGLLSWKIFNIMPKADLIYATPLLVLVAVSLYCRGTANR
jgi:hypothetical protein